MPKKKKGVKRSFVKDTEVYSKKEKIKEINIPINKRFKQNASEKSKGKKISKTLWFSFGILDLIWTIAWLIYSLYQKDLYNLTGLVFFAAGFYIFCAFILITLIYYIIKNAFKISKENA